MSMINAILDVAGPENYSASGMGWPVVILIAIALLIVGGLVAVFVAIVKCSKKKKAKESLEKKED